MTPALELGREPAVQDDRFVVSPHFIPSTGGLLPRRILRPCRRGLPWDHGTTWPRLLAGIAKDGFH